MTRESEDDYAEYYDLYDQIPADDEYSVADNPELVRCEFYGKQGNEVPALEESCMKRQCYRCYFWNKGFVAAWIDAELHGYRREATNVTRLILSPPPLPKREGGP